MILRGTGARAFRTLFYATVAIAIILLVTGHTRREAKYSLQPSAFADVSPSTRGASGDTFDTGPLCGAHGLSPYSGHDRKVYDLFLLSTELDWLEIRLHTLSPYVDYFVVVESSKTFTGLPKPLYLADNLENYTAFASKLLHFVVEDQIESSRTWDHEDFLRNALLYETFPQLVGTERQANDGDVLVVSDIDEIPKPETLMLLRHCDFPERLTLRSQFYYYSFQWLHRGEQWPHPQATVYHGVQETIAPNSLRINDGGPGFFLWRPLQRWWQKAELWNAAWHCSSCFATIAEVQTKMSSFSHTSWNTEANRDVKSIVERVRNGQDLFGREGEAYDEVPGNKDVPSYVRDNNEKFRYLLDRSGEDAAFADYLPLI